MTAISRELAICMCFYDDYTQDNVEKYVELMAKLGEDVEICYNIHPTQPVIVHKERIRREPTKYHLYPATLH